MRKNYSRSTLSPFPSVLAKTKANSLINSDLGLWKTGEVQRMFLPHEASLVLGIPLSLKKTPTVWLGLALHLGILALAVPTSSCLPRLQQTLQALPIRTPRGASGKEFGGCGCPIR